LFELIALFLPIWAFPVGFGDEAGSEELAALIVEHMSDEQALAQTFMLSWVGSTPSPLIREWIQTRNIGGIKVFGWNSADTTKLARTIGVLQGDALKGAFQIPLFVATDQEGGWIRHVKGATSETPGNMAIGASGYPMDAYWSGYYIGRELAVLGINMNFAPTVDIYTNPASRIIGPRSFGDDPIKVGILGAAYMKGQHEAGIIATAKHYPGHGDTALDSHGILPRINAPFETLWERELVPYRLLTKEGLSAVMSGHLAFPQTQAGMTPASLSSWFLQDLLRDKIGFDGIVITDDLMMIGATASAGSLSLAAKQALLAGNDTIMFSTCPKLNDPVWIDLAAAMRREPAFRARVRDAARRVLRLKLQRLRGEKAVPWIPDLMRVQTMLPDPEGAVFFQDLAARSVTSLRNNGILPLSPEKAGKVLLAGQYLEFFRIGKIAYPGAIGYWYSPETPELLTYARRADTLIFCLAKADDLGFLESLRLLNKRVIVFSVLTPVYLDQVPWIDAAIAVYSYSTGSFIAGFSALLGRLPIEGNLPFPGGGTPNR
jgi:beta-N-acetylhexosaminidase